LKLKAASGRIFKANPSGSSSPALTRAQFRAINKAVSDPTRYRILQGIARQKHCTCADLRECVPITPATLSHHLNELEEAGLITIARKGKFALPSFCREVWNRYLARLAEL